MSRTTLSPLLALLAMVTAGCGRSELDFTPDVIIADLPDTPIVTETGCTSNAMCDDGVFCNGTETCAAGLCQPGAPPSCTDPVACTNDRCDEGTRSCVNEPDGSRCAAGTTCDPVRGCVPSMATCTSDAMCADGNVCNGTERCVGGVCTRGFSLICTDGIECTVDTCNPQLGCQFRPNNAVCDDGSFCNGVERCEATIGCVAGTPAFCDDRNACTVDRCDEGARRCTSTLIDSDRDGAAPTRCGGGDCDDSDPRVGPSAPEVCNDGRDNNCDGVTDCRDRACAGSPLCGVTPCTPDARIESGALCGDRRDNDCNGATDCADPNCRAAPACVMCVPTGAENTVAVCSDGRDNDCDGFIDCLDFECRFTPRCAMCVPTGPENNAMACGDGRDNDCNGITDCADPGCASLPACVTTVPNDVCERAMVISLPGRASGETTLARDDYAPGCGSSSAPDVAFVFRNPVRQNIVIDTIGSGYDTVLGVFRDACVPRSLIACDDDGAGMSTDSRLVLMNAEPGTYFVVVDGFATGRGAFQLNVAPLLPERCSNGIDDDRDGAIDCLDPDCAADPSCRVCVPTGAENSAATCSDGRDNDCNGAVDCLDPGCARLPACCRFMGAESSPATCIDGLDNDCDGLVDCRDPQCTTLPVCCRFTATENTAATCGNGIDDDCDGLIDCRDPQCAGQGACACVPTPEVTAAACADGVDNDCDGLRDCADVDCQRLPMCCVPTAREVTAALCSDGRDNDCNGLIDCAEPLCMSLPVCCRPTAIENTPAACTNGRDDDCDGAVDCADTQCATLPVCCRPTGVENSAFTCFNGRDDDCDGAVDCADTQCASLPGCCRPASTREFGVAACTNGRDDDCDGVADCADSDCRPGSDPGSECCNGRDDNANMLIDEFSCACDTQAQCVGVGNGGPFPSNACWSTTFRICAPRCDFIGGDVFCDRVFRGTRCNVMTGECVR